MAKRVEDNLHRYAVVGAEQRLAELSKEAAAIAALFPKLRGRGFGGKRGRPKQASSEAAAPKRRRRKMSAEGRKRISDAQKLRWKKQKAGAE